MAALIPPGLRNTLLVSPSRILALDKVPSMAPYFLQNLLPKKERAERAKPLWEVLSSLTWTQWGLFFSGKPYLWSQEWLNFDLGFGLL